MIIDLIRPKQLTERKVSVMKTLSWRLIGTLDTMIISYFITGKLDVAIGIGGVEVFSKMILYYLHERAWLKVLKG